MSLGGSDNDVAGSDAASNGGAKLDSNPALVRVGDTEDRATSGAVWVRISAFLAGKAENSQRTYASAIKEWCSFLGTEAGTEQSTRAIVAATDLQAAGYIEWLKGRPGIAPRYASGQSSGKAHAPLKRAKNKSRDGLQATQSNATITKKVAILRRIYRSLLSANIGIERNPFESELVVVPAAKSGQKRPTEMIQYEKVGEILSLPDCSTAKGLRDHAILSVLFGAGLRRSELIKLRLADVRRSSRGNVYIRLRATKGKRDADQAVPAWAAKSLLELVEQRKQARAGAGDYVFVGFSGQGGRAATNRPISSAGLYQVFKQYCLLAGAGLFASPHSARATAITKLLDAGFSHREVQEFSRHASVEMVEVYDKRRYSVDENPGLGLEY